MSDHEPDNQPQHRSPRQPDHPSGMDAVQIPAPRSPLDDQPDITAPPQQPPQHQVDTLPENGLVEPEFRYDQTWKRGKRRHYNGFVERVGGAEGERLREDLAAAVRDLLDWATQHAETQTTCDDNPDGGGSDGESGTGSGEDGDAR